MTTSRDEVRRAPSPPAPEAPPQPKGTSYQRLWKAIEGLDMADDKKEWMRDRWLYEVWWFDHRAEQANLRHSILRIVAIAGGVLVPALVSVSSSTERFDEAVQWTAFAVSLLVALSVGLDSFFHFGDRWRHYRRTAELLTMEGWQFIEKAGRYREKRDHRLARFHDHEFSRFATQVEQLIRMDVEVYLSRIVQERTEAERDEEEGHHHEGPTATDEHAGEPVGSATAAPTERGG